MITMMMFSCKNRIFRNADATWIWTLSQLWGWAGERRGEERKALLHYWDLLAWLLLVQLFCWIQPYEWKHLQVSQIYLLPLVSGSFSTKVFCWKWGQVLWKNLVWWLTSNRASLDAAIKNQLICVCEQALSFETFKTVHKVWTRFLKKCGASYVYLTLTLWKQLRDEHFP